MEQLRLRNVLAHEPLVTHLSGKLWELREESQKNIYRIIYVFHTGRRIVFVHRFQGTKQKTPRREIAIAASRYRDFLAQEQEEHDRR